jgi:hypothetical protein
MMADKLYDYAKEIVTKQLPHNDGNEATIHRICKYVTNQYTCNNRYYHSARHIID